MQQGVITSTRNQVLLEARNTLEMKVIATRLAGGRLLISQRAWGAAVESAGVRGQGHLSGGRGGRSRRKGAGWAVL